MKIVIFHYHLNPGGVTRIIESQLEAIRCSGTEYEAVVLTGGCENVEIYQKLGADVVVDPQLNYLLPEHQGHKERLNYISKRIREICSKEDILHFHNLNLGKNPLVTLAVSHMAQDGYTVLNHAHDFSEDRPANQEFLRVVIEDGFGENVKEVMYPNLPNYLFAVLNGFDLNRLKEYGVPSEKCFLLANPVVFSSEEPEGDAEEWRVEVCQDLNLDFNKLNVTYPVRVIRRKNIGEFILLAALFKNEANFIVTQPPKNPVEIEPYEKWKDFCEKEGIDICWEAGNQTDFEKLLRSSDFCLTTSIQEGFGMVFMEPWLLGTPVVGRDIPMVTADLKENGIDFPLLFENLFVSENKNLHEFGVDKQMEIIRNINKQANVFGDLAKRNPFLPDLLNTIDDAWIRKNNKVILKAYSLENYGNKLYGIYRRIVG